MTNSRASTFLPLQTRRGWPGPKPGPDDRGTLVKDLLCQWPCPSCAAEARLPHLRCTGSKPGCAENRSGSVADQSHFAQQRGYAMRTFDLAPLYRSTVGFDRLFSMLDGFESPPAIRPTTSSARARTPIASRSRLPVSARAIFRSKARKTPSRSRAISSRRTRRIRRDPLPGYRSACVRARLPARRLRPGQGCGARERAPARRSRTRDPGGQEAAADPDRD